jgi:hypothetical protein
MIINVSAKKLKKTKFPQKLNNFLHNYFVDFLSRLIIRVMISLHFDNQYIIKFEVNLFFICKAVLIELN